MATTTICRSICEPPNISTIPPYPPAWPPGSGVPPIDPLALQVTCPVYPATAYVGAANLTCRVVGLNFTTTCVVYLDAIAQATTFVSVTELRFTVQPGLETVPRTGLITVRDGATTAIGTCSFAFTAAPLLTLVCPLQPSTAVCLAADLPCFVDGVNFTPTCVVVFDGVDQTTIYMSDTQLQFTVKASAEPLPRMAVVGVRDGAVIANQTCPFNFTQVFVRPIITSVLPDMVGDLDPPKTISVAGQNFDGTSVIIRNGVDMATTLVSANLVTTVTVPSTIKVSAVDIRVRNGPIANSSNPVRFEVVGNPKLNMMSPASAPANTGQVPVRLLGVNFSNKATVLVDNVAYTTVFVSNGELNFTVNTTGVPRTMNVTVRIGHDPSHVDNIRPVLAPLTLPFTVT